jgi:hypothetical protein
LSLKFARFLKNLFIFLDDCDFKTIIVYRICHIQARTASNTIRSNVFVLDTQVNCIIHNLYLFSVIEMCQWICHYARNKRFHYSFSFSLCTQYNNCWLLYCNRVNTFVILYETKPSNSLLTLLLFVVVVKKKSHIMLMIVSKKFIVVIEF